MFISNCPFDTPHSSTFNSTSERESRLPTCFWDAPLLSPLYSFLSQFSSCKKKVHPSTQLLKPKSQTLFQIPPSSCIPSIIKLGHFSLITISHVPPSPVQPRQPKPPPSLGQTCTTAFFVVAVLSLVTPSICSPHNGQNYF